MPDKNLTRIDAVMSSPSDDFLVLVQASGLDPATAFQGADLSGVDFGQSDLMAFSFSGANLDQANLSNARVRRASLLGASLEGTILPRQFTEDDLELELELDGENNSIPIMLQSSVYDWAGSGRGPLVFRQLARNYFNMPEQMQVEIARRFEDRRRRHPRTANPGRVIEIIELSRSSISINMAEVLRNIGDRFSDMIIDAGRYADLRYNYTHAMARSVFERYLKYS